MKAVTLKQAIKISQKLDVCISCGDGKTFYATNEQETEIYEFDSKIERNEAILKSRKQ